MFEKNKNKVGDKMQNNSKFRMLFLQRFNNRNNPFFKLIILISLTLFFSVFIVNCSENTKETDIEPSWKLVEELDHTNKIILNSFVTKNSNKMYISTLSDFYRLDYDTEEPIWIYNNDNGFEPLTMNYKPAIADSITAYSNENLTAVVLKLNEKTVSKSYGYEFISIYDIDSTFYDAAELANDNYFIPVGAFNNNHQFLTIIMNQGHKKSYGAYFCLIDFTIDDSYSGINISGMQSHRFCTYDLCMNDIISINDRFYVATNVTAPYIVYPNGDFQEMDVPSPLEFFNYRDTLYALTTGYNIYYSSDLGKNWEQYAHISAWVSFFKVSGRLCCHTHDHIYEVDFANEEVRELDNWGLEGNEITSINEFNGRVYISTLSGMFYRDINEFFTYKDDEGKSSIELEKIK